ncbi:MAG: oxidative damage protection protein [Pseudomonadales bacterium]|nr:oxidative damage protection protein [Pseudomonadales bacterium]
MARKVFCKKYQREMEGLPSAPYPGAKGQEIYEHISRQAWQEWQAHQVRLINEKQLSMINPEHRKYLLAQMDRFFANEAFDEAEGYVPPAH